MSFFLALAFTLIQDKPAKDADESKTGFKVDAPLVEKLTIGGQIRTRAELRNPVGYKTAVDSDHSFDAVFLRTRVFLDANIIKQLRAYVQIQDSRAWGEEKDTLLLDTADIELKQGFLEVRNFIEAPLSLKVGRMEVPQLGDARLISGLDWHNVGRSWDGVHVTYAPEGWNFQGILTNVNESTPTPATVGEAGDDYIFGVLYGSCRTVKDHEFDGYVISRYFSDAAFGTPAGDRKDWTLGLRAKGKTGPFDYSGEFDFQFGDQGDNKVRAWALALLAGFTIEHDWKPRIGVEYVYASGDDDASDDKIGTFDPIYPFGHYYHGHMDLIGWRNLHAVMLAFRIQPLQNLTLHLDGHGFWRAEENDGWYDAAKSTVRAGGGSTEKSIGYEVDLYAKLKLWERLDLMGGYSHFFAGKFVDDTGDDPAQDWLYLQATVTF